MIKSVKVTQLYEDWENLGFKQTTGFGINIVCDPDDADVIFDLIEKIADSRDPIESEEDVHTSDKKSEKW